jgi:DNA-binding beta-propeller fold protein YncE
VAAAQITGDMLLVSGRWDNTVLAIDLARAMDPTNDGTANAIVNRVRVTPDIDHGGGQRRQASGQLVNVVLSPDGRTAYVVSHSGPASNAGAQANQHGHPGLVTVLNVARALDPAHAGTLGAVETMISTGGHGPVGFAITPDGRHALVSNSEGDGTEDGGRTIVVIDLGARRVLHQVTQAWPASPARRRRWRIWARTPASAASPTPTASSSARCVAASPSAQMAAPTTYR